MHVAQLWRYPVKSMQGMPVDRLEVGPTGPAGDRLWGLLDPESGMVLSAKRYPALLTARADDTGGAVRVILPGGVIVEAGSSDADHTLSEWIGHRVVFVPADPDTGSAYEMTFDPPDDEAEYYDIPVAAGTFHDLAAIHLLSVATLAQGAHEHPELDWDVRRFRPNVVVAGALEPFEEDGWCGTDVRIGGAVLRPAQPTVRCAMPLRAQPGLARQKDLFRALSDLHNNHLGVYVDVVRSGTIELDDEVTLDAPVRA
jgi:MOSC domain-containing protein